MIWMRAPPGHPAKTMSHNGQRQKAWELRSRAMQMYEEPPAAIHPLALLIEATTIENELRANGIRPIEEPIKPKQRKAGLYDHLQHVQPSPIEPTYVIRKGRRVKEMPAQLSLW